MISQSDRTHSDWLDAFMSATSDIESPYRFRLWSAISLITSCLGRKVWLDWEGPLYSNMYIILVGPAGSMKGTAMRIPKKLLTDLKVPVASDATTREQFMMELANARKHFNYNDKQIWHSSLTVFSKEINVLINEKNRDLVINLIDWYDCEADFSYRTKGSIDSEAAGVYLTLQGAITPDLLAKSMPPESRGSGFISRTHFIYADEREKIVYFPKEMEDEIYNDLLNDLEVISQLKGSFSLDESFRKPWIVFVDKIIGDPPFVGTMLESYDNRLRVHTLKMCMILNASRCDGNMIITDEDLYKSIEILDEAQQHMLKCFIGMGTAKHSDKIPRILNEVQRRGTVAFSELLAAMLNDISRSDLSDLIAGLMAAKQIEISRIEGEADFYIFPFGTRNLLKDKAKELTTTIELIEKET